MKTNIWLYGHLYRHLHAALFLHWSNLAWIKAGQLQKRRMGFKMRREVRVDGRKLAREYQK